MLPKVQTRGTNQIVYEELKKAIISGALVPGTPLVERDLAEQMGVSRTPIHEAINRLEAEHLVARSPNKRVTVSQLSLEDLIQLYTIRTNLEVLAVTWAMAHMTDEVLEKMRKNVQRMVRYGEAEDVDRVVELNIEFHKYIMESAQSWYLSMFLDKIHDAVRLFRAQSVNQPGRISRIVRDHRDILKAFEEKDLDAAVKHITDHVRGALEGLVSQYKAMEGEDGPKAE